MKPRWSRWRFFAGLTGVLALIGGASAGVYRLRQTQPTTSDVPVAQARQGEFLVVIQCRGELKAGRSVQLYAPIVPSLRISWLAPSGEIAQQGQPVIKFDSSSAEQQLVQKEAALRQAQATLDQLLAQRKIVVQQDQADLANMRYNLDNARLEASKKDVVSRIQGEESRIDLGVAEQSLKAQEAWVELHTAAFNSQVASVKRQLEQAQADVDVTKARLAQMVINAPVTGFVVFASNNSQGPLTSKPFAVGDTVFAGMNLAEMPDLSTLQMDIKVDEIDRGRVTLGDDARIHVDALPELALPAKINQISPMAELGIDMTVSRTFRAYAALPHPDPRLRPGMNGGVDIVVQRIPKAISIPAQALLTRAGKPVVYLADRGAYRPVEVQLLARNPDEVAISGVPAGSLVALADPEKRGAKK